MLRRIRSAGPRTSLSVRGRRGVWTLALLDVMAVAWMLAAGDWFDTTSRLTAVVTLGGHHLVVLWLAAGGLALFAATALLSRDFTEVTRLHTVMLGVAGVASAVALGGATSVVALAVGALLLTALVARTLLR